MKINITFKDPDGVYDSIREAVLDSLPEDISADEAEELKESRTEKVNRDLKKWLQYGECCRIEIDTEAGTAIVLPVK